MLITDSISGYRHINFGSIKLAFTMVCRDDIFRDVYFNANSLYYVRSGTAIIQSDHEEIVLEQGEIAFIRQHSRLDIRKLKSESADFSSVIFFLFPDFVAEFLKGKNIERTTPDQPDASVLFLGRHPHLHSFSESLLPLFDITRPDTSLIQSKSFEVLHLLARRNKELLPFLLQHARPIKIDLYEFMLHNELTEYSVEELARLTGRSLSAFKRDFSSVFNTTPHRWILHRKIDYAERLLKEKGMKASAIYHFLGFKELSHFCAAFKKLKGVSPTRI